MKYKVTIKGQFFIEERDVLQDSSPEELTEEDLKELGFEAVMEKFGNFRPIWTVEIMENLK